MMCGAVWPILDNWQAPPGRVMNLTTKRLWWEDPCVISPHPMQSSPLCLLLEPQGVLAVFLSENCSSEGTKSRFVQFWFIFTMFTQTKICVTYPLKNNLQTVDFWSSCRFNMALLCCAIQWRCNFFQKETGCTCHLCKEQLDWLWKCFLIINRVPGISISYPFKDQIKSSSHIIFIFIAFLSDVVGVSPT